MRQTIGEKIFNIFNMILMVALCIIMVYPYINQFAIALNEGRDTMLGGITVFPRKFTMVNFTAVLSNPDFLNAAVISVSKVALNTILSVAVTYLAAFSLTRKGLPFKRGITLYFMIPAYISAGVIPVYMLYRYLHLIDNYWVYVLPGIFVFYNMVIIRSFLQELPDSIDESAWLDGANDFQIMYKITVPMSLPVIATVILWVGVASWNEYNSTLMYITNRKLYTLQYLMMQIIKESELAQQMAIESAMGNTNVNLKPTSDSVRAATLILTTLPIIMIYPWLQKYFVKGVNLGAVKG